MMERKHLFVGMLVGVKDHRGGVERAEITGIVESSKRRGTRVRVRLERTGQTVERSLRFIVDFPR